MKIDEYAPEAMPIISAKAKSRSVSPPNSSSASTGSSVQKLVASERVSTSDIERLTICEKAALRHSRHVLANTVEHDDRVVQRVPQDRQQSGDRGRRDFPPHERVDACRYQQVVHQRDQHRDRVLPLESQRDVGGDHQQRGDQRDHGAVGDGFSERRPDRGRGEVFEFAEARGQALFDLRDAGGLQRLGRDLEAVLSDARARSTSAPRRSRSRASTSPRSTCEAVAGLCERRSGSACRT